MSNTGYFTPWVNLIGEATPWAWRIAVLLFALTLSMILARILRTPQSARDRWSFWEVLLVLVGFGGLMILRVPSMATMGGSFDEDLWLAGAITLKTDPRFWIAFDGTTSGPLTVYPLMLPYLWGGVANYGLSRLLTALFWGGNACLFFASLRHLVNHKIAAITATSLFSFLGACNVADYVMFNGEHVPIFCMSLAFWMISRHAHSNSAPFWQCLIIGLLLGAAPFGKLQAGPLAFALGIFAVLKFRTGNARSGLIIGAVLPLLGVLIYACQEECLYEVWRLYVISTLKYAASTSGQPWIVRALAFPSAIFNCIDSRLFFMVQVLVAIGGMVGLLETARRGLQIQWGLTFSFIWLLIAVMSIIQTGQFFHHYFLFLLTPLLLWNSLSWNEVVQRLPDVQQGIAAPWKARHAAYCCFLAAIMPVVPAVRFGHASIPRGHFPLPLSWTDPFSDEIQRWATPQSYLVVWGHRPEIYVQTNLPSGTRYAYPHLMHVSWADADFHLQLFLRDLKRHSQLIFVEVPADPNSQIPVPPVETIPQLAAELATRFHHVATVGECRIWQTRPAPATD